MNVSLEPILLAGMSVRAIAESAVRAGYQVMALDYFGDRDLRGLCPGISLMRDLEQPYAPEQFVAAARDLPAAAVAYSAVSPQPLAAPSRGLTWRVAPRRRTLATRPLCHRQPEAFVQLPVRPASVAAKPPALPPRALTCSGRTPAPCGDSRR